MVPAPFIDKTILSPVKFLSTFIKNQLAINIKVYFWTLDSVPLIDPALLKLAFLCCLSLKCICSDRYPLPSCSAQKAGLFLIPLSPSSLTSN